MGVLGLIGQAVTVTFLTIFLLNENDAFKRKPVRRMDTLGRKRVTVHILNAIAKQIEGFIWVQALTSSGDEGHQRSHRRPGDRERLSRGMTNGSRP